MSNTRKPKMTTAERAQLDADWKRAEALAGLAVAAVCSKHPDREAVASTGSGDDLTALCAECLLEARPPTFTSIHQPGIAGKQAGIRTPTR